MNFKVFTKQDGQQVIKVYMKTRSENVSVVYPYCYISIEDKDLIERGLHANKDLYTSKSINSKNIGLHRLIVSRVENIPLDKLEIADHINGVPLDNTRPNLRSADRCLNANNYGYHYSKNGSDRRLGLDILELEMRGIISVEQGDEIYNKRIDGFYKKGIQIVDYFSFAFWFRDDDLHFYAPDLYDFIPEDMLRELVKNTFTEYHRLDILEYTMEEKKRLQDLYEYPYYMPERRVHVTNGMILHNIYPQAYKKSEPTVSSFNEYECKNLMQDFLAYELASNPEKRTVDLHDFLLMYSK